MAHSNALCCLFLFDLVPNVTTDPQLCPGGDGCWVRMLQQRWSPLPTAAPVTFVKALHNLELQEGGTAHLSCELSKPDVPVEWKKGTSVIQPSHKCSIQQEGKVHTLLIRDLNRADSGEYSCHTAAGKTTARLEVKGRGSSVPSTAERRED